MSVTYAYPAKSATVPRYSMTITCSTGTETANPPTLATDGLSLVGMRGLDIEILCAAASAGSLLWYGFNPQTVAWHVIPGLDLVVPAGVTAYGWPGVPVVGQNTRMALIPSGIGVSSVITVRASTVA